MLLISAALGEFLSDMLFRLYRLTVERRAAHLFHSQCVEPPSLAHFLLFCARRDTVKPRLF